MGLHCAECDYRVVGFTFAGTPGVVIGHNSHIAWGVTNQALDTQDLFVERVNPDDPGQYQVDGEWVDFETWTEVIRVAGAEPVTVEMRRTRHGPVISGTFLEEGELDGTAALELPPEYVVALAWTTLEPSTLFEAVYRINRAATYDEFREALTYWDIAAQNFVYADTDGNIAYQSTGKVPLRAQGDGTWPVPGWTSEYGWTGVVPVEALPGLLNPDKGYVVSANQTVQRPGAEPFMAAHSAYGFRAARIDELLAAGRPHTVASMQAIQMDARDGGAPHVVGHLLAVPAGGSDAIADIQRLLAAWAEGPEPFSATADSGGAAAYQAVWRHLLLETFGDEVGEDHLPDGGGRWFQAVRLLLDDPDDPWWDDVRTEARETRDDMLRRAMEMAAAELTAVLGGDPERWAWGRLHRATFENQTLGKSGIPPIEWLFNRSAPPRVAGSRSLVNATGWTPENGYVVDWLPAMRIVVDLADLSASTLIHTTGQSGHPFHRHYTDMIEPWTDGVQVPLPWEREKVAAVSTLELVPERD
jgi:penicillin amidase